MGGLRGSAATAAREARKVEGLEGRGQALIRSTVLKIGPDRPVRPVQPGTGSQSGPVNTLKTGQKPENRSKTGQKPGLNRKLKKNGLMSGSVFKTMVNIT